MVNMLQENGACRCDSLESYQMKCCDGGIQATITMSNEFEICGWWYFDKTSPDSYLYVFENEADMVMFHIWDNRPVRYGVR